MHKTKTPLAGAPEPPVLKRSSAANLTVGPKRALTVITSPIALSTEWRPQRIKTERFPDQAVAYSMLPPTIPNVTLLLRENGIAARYNVIKKRRELFIPNLKGVIDNGDKVSIAHVKSLMAMHGMPNGDARSILDAIANQEAYNPVADWIDGMSVVRTFGTTRGVN